MKKFTMFFMAIFAALSLQAAELNIYACGLNATVSDNVATVEYVLNAPATGLELQLYAAGADPILVPITAAEALTKGAHSVEVDLSGVKAGTYTWGLKASAAATTAYAEVTNNTTDAWKFYSPQGIAVNKNPESPFFGNVYVTMPNPGGSDGAGGCARTNTQKAGLYILNSRLEALNDSAYQFGLTFEDAKREQFKRISVSPNDDKLYVNDITHKKVYIIDPNDLTKVDSTIEAAGHFTYPASLVAGATNWYLLDYPNTTTGAALVRFNKATGAMDTLLQSTKWVNGESSIAFDGRGGMWVCQYRGQLDVYPCISHMGAADTIDYLINKNSSEDLKNLIDRSTGSTYSTRGAMAVSPSGHLLAMAMNRCARVYAVTYDEATGIPSMSIAYTTPTLGKNIDGMAFDAADNLYISSASSERLYVYATTKADNSFVTPAAAAKTIVVEEPFVPKEGDNILWTINDVNASFGDITAANNKYRDLAYYNNQLIVLTNPLSSNQYLLRFNANTGTYKGRVSMKDVSGGDIALSSIQILDNGEMVAMCCRVNPTTGTVKFYGWDNLDADPTLLGNVNLAYASRVEALYYRGTLSNGKFYCGMESSKKVAVIPVVDKAVVADQIHYITLDQYTMETAPRVVSATDSTLFICCKGKLYGWDLTDSVTAATANKKYAELTAKTQEATNGVKMFEFGGEKYWATLNFANKSAASLADPQVFVATYTSIGRWSAAGKTQKFLSDSSLLATTLRNTSFQSGIAVRVNENGYNVWMCSLNQGIVAYQYVAPKYLNDVLADKTIRRALNDQEHVYVLAVDADKNPTLVKADFDGKIVTEYATDFCTKNANGMYVLSDIALTDDSILIGCNANQMECYENGRTVNVYKWAADGTGEIAKVLTTDFKGSHNPISANFGIGQTGVSMAYYGNWNTGKLVLAAKGDNNTAASYNKIRFVLHDMTTTVIGYTNYATVGTSSAVITDPMLVKTNNSDKFVFLGSNIAPQMYNFTGLWGTNCQENVKTTLAATYNGAQGVSVAKKDAADWMMIPSIDGVEILNITAGLASAPQVHNLTAASTVEASFMYAGLVEDGAKVVLMRGTSLELIDVPGTGTEIEEVEAAGAEVKKVMINGHIYILRAGHMYDMSGMLVK